MSAKIFTCYLMIFFSCANWVHTLQPHEVVICAVFQNEEFFLKEWLDYHIKIGVDYFYLYDNGSNDSSRMIVEPYVESGYVCVMDWTVETHSQGDYLNKLQLPIYNHALRIVKENAKWAAFIDIDEFIVPVKHKNLKEMLSEFSNCAAIVVNWQVYGTSGYHSLPSGSLLTECLIRKGKSDLEVNQLVKMIVQPQFVISIEDPHFFIVDERACVVNGEGKPLASQSRYQPISIDTVRINHYWFGTEKWFRENKLPRRAQWGLTISDEAIPTLIDLFNTEEDLAILTHMNPVEIDETH